MAPTTPYVATHAASLASRRHFTLPNGCGIWKTEFIRADPAATPAPHAFLIEQEAGGVVMPHFHEQNQFQIVVNGGGSLGRNAVSPLVVHYAGAHTGYGPITAGPHGLWYFTLRAMLDNGALFVHESRDRLKRGPKKHFHSEPLPTLDATALAALDRSYSVTVANDDDGMRVEQLHLAPRGELPIGDLAASGGAFVLVTAGHARFEGATLDRLGCAFVQAGDEPGPVRAGEAGAQVLVLQFPRAEYRRTFDAAASKYHKPQAAEPAGTTPVAASA